MRRIKHCPCCNSKEVKLQNKYNNFYVECLTCFLRTQNFGTEESAIMYWNMRNREEKYEKTIKELQKSVKKWEKRFDKLIIVGPYNCCIKQEEKHEIQ